MAKKELEMPTQALQNANKKAEQVASKILKGKIGRGKSASDYLRLDLVPDGEDLKTYVLKRAAEVSAETGNKVSSTKYIQDLIRADQKAQEGRGSKNRLYDAIMGLDADKVAVIEALIRSWK